MSGAAQPRGNDRGDAHHRGRPRWLQALRFIGRPPALSSHQWRVLGVVGAANLFDNYGMAILGLALPQIQRSLGVAEADVGRVTAVVRLGVIPAIFLTVLADAVGRRRLLLVTILGFAASSFLTAFARDAEQFMALQFVSRVFIAGEAMLAVVVVVEELDASTRGWGIGVLGALGASGHGLASFIFAAVNLLPYGWRALYALGVLPMLLLAWFRRSLTETRRFTAHQQRRGAAGLATALVPFRNLLVMYPGRMLALCAALFPFAFVTETAMLFTSKHLQEIHHYSPGNVALLNLTFGVMAPIGNILAGNWGDRFGRKRVMIAGLLLNAAALGLFYNASGWWLPVAWGLLLLTLMLALVLFAALGSELFPTSYRSTASGVRAIVATMGAAAGLWTEGWLYGIAGSHAAAITWMLMAGPIAPLIVAVFLPETASRELEEIAPEREVSR